MGSLFKATPESQALRDRVYRAYGSWQAVFENSTFDDKSVTWKIDMDDLRRHEKALGITPIEPPRTPPPITRQFSHWIDFGLVMGPGIIMVAGTMLFSTAPVWVTASYIIAGCIIIGFGIARILRRDTLL